MSLSLDSSLSSTLKIEAVSFSEMLMFYRTSTVMFIFTAVITANLTREWSLELPEIIPGWGGGAARILLTNLRLSYLVIVMDGPGFDSL
jgi:hypothetical protein